MNERIRELSNRAWESITVQDALDDEAFDSFDQKFAELIVRECVSQCWTVSEIEHRGNVISECSKRMEKHFGVEE